MDDAAICALLTRLARPHASGGEVVERSALLAAGGDFAAVMAWLTAHGGKPEATAPARAGRGLHGSLIHASAGGAPRAPLRFVLPAGALTGPVSPDPTPAEPPQPAVASPRAGAA